MLRPEPRPSVSSRVWASHHCLSLLPPLQPAAQEQVTADSLSDFTLHAHHYPVFPFQLLAWTRLKRVWGGGHNHPISWHSHSFIYLRQVSLSLGKMTWGCSWGGQGAGTWAWERSMDCRSGSLFLTTGIFSSAWMEFLVVLCAQPQGDYAGQTPRNCWEARGVWHHSNWTVRAVFSCLWSCCSTQRNRSLWIWKSQWPIQGPISLSS